jgi:hypothetical protein
LVIPVVAFLGKYETPYGDLNLKIDFQVLYQVAEKGKRPKMPSRCPQPLADLIARILDKDAEVRPTTGQLLEELEKIFEIYNSNKEEWDAMVANK